MKRCIELVRTNRKFRKSVNLQLDLGNGERVESYIPTRSSIAVLERYFDAVAGRRRESAALLIGPYGKGKSHLLLVLLALLGGDQKVCASLIGKIARTDAAAAEKIAAAAASGKRYLPVLVNPAAGNDLNQVFAAALREALLREGLGNLAPESCYSEAVKAIEGWRRNFPDTYQAFAQVLARQQTSVEAFERSLLAGSREALDFFTGEYPLLTAGSMFVPLLAAGALDIYRQTGRILTEENGYAGIFIVFDEFSKYVEGHSGEGFAADMKTLQDLCELAEDSGQQLFLTLVAHKSIRTYAKGIPAAAKNAFRGVEGRLAEIEFVVSAQNNYELIADAITKLEPGFSLEYGRLSAEESYRNFVEESRGLPCFRKLFSAEEFERILAKGCFPLAPAVCYALIQISERIAQNERTVFTFLAGDGQGGLAWLLERDGESLVGIDKIYDYFRSLFRETTDQPKLHGEWLKAEDALAKTADRAEQAVIKAIAVIRMVGREEEFPAKKQTIRLALAMEEETCARAVDALAGRELIVYRSKSGFYAFRGNVGVDVEKEIANRMAEYGNRDIVCQTLADVTEMRYELPRQHNQNYAITRYFSYVYLRTADFLRLASAEYLFEEEFSDGKILVLIPDEETDGEALQEKLDVLSDDRLLVLAPQRAFRAEPLVRRYAAIEALLRDARFIGDNQVLRQELALCREDIAFEINAKMEEHYLPENGNVWIYRRGRPARKGSSAAEFGAVLSEICDAYYCFSPRVNHELVNVRTIGPQYLRARNTVVQRLLAGQDCSVYLTGTSPECLVYRAAFVHTAEDGGCRRVFSEIDSFLRDCAGRRRSFAALYKRLGGRDYGVRKGVLPLFLAKKLADMDAAAAIYVGKREMAVDYAALNQVNEAPESYELYLEQETAEKERYLQMLEQTFGAEGAGAGSRQERLGGIIRRMQGWYRSLPQYARVTERFAPEDVQRIDAFRSALKRAQVNPRELLFDRLPELFGGTPCGETAQEIGRCKELLDGKLGVLKRELAAEIKTIFGAGGTSSLKACLKEWQETRRDVLKSYIVGAGADRLWRYLETLDTNDEEEIAARISKIVLDVYIEDWHDDTMASFSESLCLIKQQTEELCGREERADGYNRIILKDADGNETERRYETGKGDSTSLYLKNMLSEALEEFGDTLETNQKVAVLVEMLEEMF